MALSTVRLCSRLMRFPTKTIVNSCRSLSTKSADKIGDDDKNNNSILSAYLQLSKCRLTALIACTSVCGFMMSPVFPSATPPALFTSCVVGTALLSAAASTFNNVIERQYDKQMIRTRTRVLPVGRLTAAHALVFASATGIAGLGILCLSCNHITSALGFANVALYACVYTPMKRIHHSCTWIGAIVGAIPPLMGYAAANGHLDLSSIVLGAVLFSWQFPHFNALSWKLRNDYANAGYRMMCVSAVPLCRKTTMRHSAVLLLLCSAAAPMSHLTTWSFAVTSLPLNCAMLFLSSRFYANMDQKNATNLFRFTLLYLPLLLSLMFISKGEHQVDDRIGIEQLKGIILMAKNGLNAHDFFRFLNCD